jgi:F0F1-type ATP synthase membrane subunit b/b'
VPWFEKEMDYARESLEKVASFAIDRAGERLGQTVHEGIAAASQELREIILGASHEVDSKLDKTSEELHSQRQFTKADVKELVDYAADRLTVVAAASRDPSAAARRRRSSGVLP